MPEIGTLLTMSYLGFDSFDLILSLFRYDPLRMHESYRNDPGFDEKDLISYTPRRDGEYRDFQ